MGISVGFFTEATSFLRNPGARRTPSPLMVIQSRASQIINVRSNLKVVLSHFFSESCPLKKHILIILLLKYSEEFKEINLILIFNSSDHKFEKEKIRQY